MDPRLICKKSRKLRGKLADICRNETALLREVAKGVAMGSAECGFQFRSRRWNCTSVRRSMKKILVKGELLMSMYVSVPVASKLQSGGVRKVTRKLTIWIDGTWVLVPKLSISINIARKITTNEVESLGSAGFGFPRGKCICTTTRMKRRTFF